MHIGYLAQQSGIKLNDRSGGVVHVKGIIQGLRKAGHSVTYLTFGKSVRQVFYTGDLETMTEANTGLAANPVFRWFESGVRRVQRELKLPYLAFFDSYRYFEACRHTLQGYDVIHERFSMLGAGGTLAARRMGLPLVLEVNADLLEEEQIIFGTGPGSFHRRVKYWISQMIFRNAVCLLPVSNPLKTHLIKRWGVPEEKISVLPCAADVENFDPRLDPVEMRRQLGLVEAPSTIFIGSFYPWHASLDLVESFALVTRKIPSARLYLVGQGPMTAETKERVRALDLEKSVVFVGAVPHEEIPKWLAASDLAVAPYIKFEKDLWFSPLKLFEYMAAGRAVVASRVGQVLEIIQDGENGVLVEPGDKMGFAQAMVDLLKSPAERQRMGEQAYCQAIERHSWDQIARELEGIYRDVRGRAGISDKGPVTRE